MVDTKERKQHLGIGEMEAQSKGAGEMDSDMSGWGHKDLVKVVVRHCLTTPVAGNTSYTVTQHPCAKSDLCTMQTHTHI